MLSPVRGEDGPGQPPRCSAPARPGTGRGCGSGRPAPAPGGTAAGEGRLRRRVVSVDGRGVEPAVRLDLARPAAAGERPIPAPGVVPAASGSWSLVSGPARIRARVRGRQKPASARAAGPSARPAGRPNTEPARVGGFSGRSRWADRRNPLGGSGPPRNRAIRIPAGQAGGGRAGRPRPAAAAGHRWSPPRWGAAKVAWLAVRYAEAALGVVSQIGSQPIAAREANRQTEILPSLDVA